MNDDGDPLNGIQLTAATQAAAVGLSVGFTSATFASDAQGSTDALVALTTASSMGARGMVSSLDAQTHFNDTLLCTMAGIYNGTYNGDDAASGAAQTVPFVQVTHLARCLRDLKERGIWLVGLDGHAEQTLYDTDLKGPLGMVMSAEGQGLRRLSKEHCDYLVRIPMAGTVESLNISVATGVCLFEALRQRQ